MRLLQNTSNLSFCGSPRGEAEGLTAESINILSSIIDSALSRRMTEIEFCNSLYIGTNLRYFATLFGIKIPPSRVI
ncbi:MAG: hypothetical protein ABIH18_09220 [Candidatus Omnitrophota bacterium]